MPGTGQIMKDERYEPVFADLSVWRDVTEVPDGNKSYVIYVGGGKSDKVFLTLVKGFILQHPDFNLFLVQF